MFVFVHGHAKRALCADSMESQYDLAQYAGHYGQFATMKENGWTMAIPPFPPE